MSTLIKYGLVEYELVNTVEEPDYSYPNYQLINPLNGNRYNTDIRYYDTFMVTEYLFKINDLGTEILLYKDLDALQGKRVLFKPYLETDYLKDTNGNYLYFYVTNLATHSIVRMNENDIAIIKLASETFVNQFLDDYIVDEDGNWIDLGDGDGYIIKE